jgi:putative ABC transport system substrate-binding protein
MKTRRDVMPLIAGGAAAVAWPLAARGQLNGPMRRVGALMHFAPDATGGKERLAAFHQGLRAAGWEGAQPTHRYALDRRA